MKTTLLIASLAFVAFAGYGQMKPKQDTARIDTMIHFKPITPTQLRLVMQGIQNSAVLLNNSDVASKDRVPAVNMLSEILKFLQGAVIEPKK